MKHVLLNKLIQFDKNLLSAGAHIFLNPFSYNILRDSNLDFTKISSVSADGIILVKLVNFLLRGAVVRTSFDMTSFAPVVFEDAIFSEKKLAFVGSTDTAINDFIQVVINNYPDLDIVFYRDGYFDGEKDLDDCIDKVIQSEASILVVGMGSPLQEFFVLKALDKGFKGAAYTCGGFIHQTAKGLIYYPDFFNRYNLRWLYRIYDEPKLLKRYFIQYPISIFNIVKDMLEIKM